MAKGVLTPKCLKDLQEFQFLHGLQASNPSLPRTPNQQDLALLQCESELTMIILNTCECQSFDFEKSFVVEVCGPNDLQLSIGCQPQRRSATMLSQSWPHKMATDLPSGSRNLKCWCSHATKFQHLASLPNQFSSTIISMPKENVRHQDFSICFFKGSNINL
jgi:hypothetical protein